MGARAQALVLLLIGATASADPKPKPVDVSAFRGKLVVLEDDSGGTYAVLPDSANPRVWYGTGKTLYEQIRIGSSADDDSWDISVWAPRVPNVQPGSVQRQHDGSFHRWCGGDSDLKLKPLTADRAKVVLDHVAFMSSATMRVPHVLARDDAGIYYYIDRLRAAVGGGGYRVFVGKKGAMKQLALSDVATDTAGDVFATPDGEVRFVHDNGQDSATWIHNKTKTPLTLVDVDASSRLIFKDLGIYTFLGTLCDDL
ncbi:MAG TPA: hypothetical protein VGG74_16645 [Kofleriaceae bacterium]|jgi:hypothetical protein